MKNFSYKKSSEASDEDLEVDLDRNPQPHLKVTSENLDENFLVLQLFVWKYRLFYYLIL